MEEGEGVQRLVQVTNLTKDSFLFPDAKYFFMGGVGLVLGVWGSKTQFVNIREDIN